jgi:hypothetical protein
VPLLNRRFRLAISMHVIRRGTGEVEAYILYWPQAIKVSPPFGKRNSTAMTTGALY